ncbi:CDP-diacylglycerol--serine O-phosphatidyltransferase [Methanocaldococcus villosus KIN24-T80]|uniref:CDP-diacylglycerol--serine O-phosphatidyltransferase n=1 Tax=Methanocaldococcus villosus KIN24-T80 TaxID=1069083 RepID=N6VXK5_9EURY|nr:CDP-diacylglycerol--serine O-phosphatidyltransferase [Methanocaldococcus villosus]ENN95867.1 CDP-diacylglycerol--serine O-phosphatidyltransferase [Methanocaldococcus villosus KIN24-T80]
MRIFKLITVSDYVTILNAVSGILAILLNNYHFIYLAVIFDALDGYVARKTQTVSEFGKELDSLADVISFSIAPAYFFYLKHGLILLPIIYSICGMLRLARFNIIKTNNFIGLPIPAAALCMITLISISDYTVLNSLFLLLVSFLMISDFEYKKYFKNEIIILILISLILAIMNFPYLLMILLIIYIISPIIELL